VLYDAKDGEIQHVHTVITMTGADASTPAQVEKRAFELAKQRLGANAAKLKALHIDSSALEAGRRFRVDVKRRALVDDHSASR